MTSQTLLRIEPDNQSGTLEPGLAARLLDPLWLLARQWTLGEFDGDDAGTPVEVEATLGIRPISQLHGSLGSLQLATPPKPLEIFSQAAPRLATGPTLKERIEIGSLLLHLLAEAGASKAGEAAAKQFPIEAPVGSAPEVVRTAAIARGRVPDGVALLETVANGATIPAALREPSLAPILEAWWAISTAILAPSEIGSWRPERLEHSATLECEGLSAPLTLPDQAGEALNWTSADLTSAMVGPAPQTIPIRRTPTALRFSGMPQARYWEFEDATIDLGAVDAPSPEIARVAVLQFALLFGNDVFLIPAQIPFGCLASIETLSLRDSFADIVGSSIIPPAIRAGNGAGQGFAMYACDFAGSPQPCVFFPPPFFAPVIGRPIEEALLARDETANRAWLISTSRAGPDGRVAPPAASPVRVTSGGEGDFTYSLATETPAGWVPLTLETPQGQRRLLRREAGGTDAVRFLPSGAAINDEALSGAGLILRLEPFLVRSIEGEVLFATRLCRLAGRGGAGSGLRFDVPQPNE